MSFQELAVVFIIGLLVLGPERLPGAARQVGRWVGRARRTASELRYMLERQIALAEIDESQERRTESATGRDDAADVKERDAARRSGGFDVGSRGDLPVPADPASGTGTGS